jgi:hypothetical protein
MVMDAETTKALLILTDVLSWISLVCNLFLLIAYSCDAGNRKFPSRVFLYSIGSCLLTNVGVVINSLADRPYDDTDSTACRIQGFFIYYGYLSWNIWVLILSIDLFVIIGRSQMLKRPKFAEAGMVIAAWGVPLAPAITFLVLDLFSGRELWCSVAYTTVSVALYAFWIPSLVLVVAAEVFFALLIDRLVKAGRKAENRTWRNAIFSTAKRMIIFLFCYGIVNITRSVLRIVQISEGKSELDPVGVAFYTIFTNTTGIVHMAVFGTTKTPYLALRRTVMSSRVSNNEELEN